MSILPCKIVAILATIVYHTIITEKVKMLMTKPQLDETERVVKALKVLGMSASVDAGQLLSDIIDEWGGTRKLAHDIKDAFDTAPPGSMTRQRFFEMLQRLIISNTDRDISREIDPSEFSDDELARAAHGILGRVLGESNGQKENQAVVQRGVEDELERPEREADPVDIDSPDDSPPTDGGWGDWGK